MFAIGGPIGGPVSVPNPDQLGGNSMRIPVPDAGANRVPTQYSFSVPNLDLLSGAGPAPTPATADDEKASQKQSFIERGLRGGSPMGNDPFRPKIAADAHPDTTQTLPEHIQNRLRKMQT